MARSPKHSEHAVVDWLMRDRFVIDGLDHLGIEVVSVNIYASLLPGITNVTDRARYYSFYPWVLHRYAQRGTTTTSKAGWLRWLRRLEFMYAMACAAHEKQTGTAMSAVVGIDTARPLVGGASGSKVLDIEDATALNEKAKPLPDAYFARPEGGLRQYYRVALETLGLIVRDEKLQDPDVALTEYAGRHLADAVDQAGGFDELLALAEKGQAKLAKLFEVGALVNPLAIAPGSSEQARLRALFMGTDSDLCVGQDKTAQQWRAATLRLILQYLRDVAKPVDSVPDKFRWACLERALPDGSSWEVPSWAVAVQSAWAGYQRNEILNLALEGLFWAGLRAIEEGAFTPMQLARHLIVQAREAVAAKGKWPKEPALGGTVGDLMADCRDHAHEPWGGSSTWTWVQRLRKGVENDDPELVCRMAVRLLGRLAADPEVLADRPFGALPSASRIISSYEVHLGSWVKRCRSQVERKLADPLEELVLEWVVYRHLRVATRKLAAQGVSTFKLRPEEGRLVLLAQNMPEPTFTNPRLRQAVRILADLGYLNLDDKVATLTGDGLAVLEGLHD